MNFEVDGWPGAGHTLDLDHRSFSYAGKFVMSNTGKATVRDDGRILAAASFNADRTDERTMWIRYLTVHEECRGAGIGSRLLAALRVRILDREYDRVRIAVNNPYAYVAAHRAGFGFTGSETGIAELICASDADREQRYADGLERFRTREDLEPSERQFVADRIDASPPTVIEPPIPWETIDVSP